MARREFGSILKRAGGAVRARYRIDGRDITKTFRPPRAAAQARQWLRDEQIRREKGLQPRPRRAVGYLQYLKDFAPRCEAKVAKRTWRSYKSHLEEAGRFFRNAPLPSIGVREADSFMLHIGQRVGASTTHRYRATLSKMWQWAIREGHVRMNPWRLVELEKPDKPLHEFLSPEDVKKRLDLLPTGSELKLFAELAYETGLRLSENAGLMLQDVPLSGARRVIVRKSKSHEGRVVPLTVGDGVTRGGQEVMDEILALPRVRKLRGLDQLWSHSAEWFCRQYSIVMKEAEIPDRLHELRHACASRLARAERLQVVQLWMGHKSLLTTRKYVHTPMEDLFRAAERVGEKEEEDQEEASSG